MAEQLILTERRGHILLIGLNRPEKRNAATFDMLSALAAAYGELDDDPELSPPGRWRDAASPSRS